MSLFDTLHRGVDAFARWPGVRSLAERQARQRFLDNRDENLFWGVYESWDEASAAANDCGRTGYDNPESADLYLHRTRLDTYDYPALYWISRSLQEGLSSVFDVGGSIGIKYLAFREPLAPYPRLTWKVQDVPAVIRRGAELAQQRGDATTLTFTDKFDDGNGIDLLFASGVVQYLPQTLGALLGNYKRLPKRIVINTAAIHPDREFFTVNSIGTAFCPYRVQTQASFIRELQALGYRLREVWRNPGKSLVVPMHPDYSVENYLGFCLDLPPKQIRM
jgi:putative methyltransferase (TIGR04325 family)